jgi:signal transduction histidine kinase
MSHEIRTPLNGIIAFADLLIKTNLVADQLEYSSIINESNLILMEIINDVLDFSKIESRKLELNIEEIDFFASANQVINRFKDHANLKNNDLVLQIDSDVSQSVFFDSVRLKQIIVNLLGNALKFTADGLVSLSIIKIRSDDDTVSTINFRYRILGLEFRNRIRKKYFILLCKRIF